METPPDGLDVWVLAGQSNMEGCGLLQDASAPDERVWSFSSSGQWQIAEEPLHRLWESFTPVHQDFMRPGLSEEDRALSNEEIAVRAAKDRCGGAGLGIAFAQAMADATGKTIGLLPAAHGGTSLEQWSPALKEQGGHSLYGAMLERIREAGKTARFNLRGVLWYQGESDCSVELAETYQQRFSAWIEAVRADLNRPDLPVLMVQLGRVLVAPPDEQDWQGRSWEQVREAFRVLPETIPHTGATSAIDLGLCDGIHIDTPGLMRLGKRLARVAIGLEKGETVGPHLVRIETDTPQPNGLSRVRVVCEGVTGGWQPRQHISGFGVRDPKGDMHPSVMIIAANADAREPQVINIVLSSPPDDTVRLGYGLGLSPYCNATDAADMPLLAFSSQPVLGQ